MAWTRHFARYPPTCVLLGMLVQAKVSGQELPFARLPLHDPLLGGLREEQAREDAAFKDSFAREAAHFGWD